MAGNGEIVEKWADNGEDARWFLSRKNPASNTSIWSELVTSLQQLAREGGSMVLSYALKAERTGQVWAYEVYHVLCDQFF